jgi:hypothetical protein
MLLSKLTKEQLSGVTSRYLGLYDGKQYSIPDLEYIVKYTAVNLRAILKTQKKLTELFCREYLLSGNYTVFDGDDILVSDVIEYQEHLTSCFQL